MSSVVTETTIDRVLTRTSGYLATVCSHSLQPYQGCTLGRALCGVGCYVQHNAHLTRGRPWGGFLEVRMNAADSYRAYFAREQAWGRMHRGQFSVFMSSATDPLVPQEFRYGISRQVLEAMIAQPPDVLILQTHSHRVVAYLPLLLRLLGAGCRARVHVSIETDDEQPPGLPPHASSIAARLDSANQLKAAGVPVVVTVSPLLPVVDPEQFLARIATAADAVVIDHFIEGDGSHDGSRTRRTALPGAMARIDPDCVGLEYRDRIVAVAKRHLPGRVGVGRDGFAGRYC